MSKKIVLVNQTANYLFADIIRAFAQKHPDCIIEAWYGSFDYDITSLPAQVILAQGPKYRRDSFKERFRSWVSFYLWLRKKVKNEHPHNTFFFFVSNPPLFVFLRGLKRLNFSCLIYDLYPDVLAGLPQNAFVKRLSARWAKRNRKVFLKAKHIYTIGEGLKSAIEKYTATNNVLIVPIWNKQANTFNGSTRDFRKEWGLEEKKIILYSGNIGLTHPLEYLIDLAKHLQVNEDWQVLIVGNGNKKAQLQEAATGLSNIMFKDPVPFDDLQQLLSIATWGYVTLDTSATNTSVPSKTFNLLAAGIPVLALVNESSEIARLLDQYDTGLYFTEKNIENTVQKLVAFSETEHTRLSQNAISCSKDFTAVLAEKFAEDLHF